MDDNLLAKARDAGYTAVGFGVLAAQRLQVRRRELTKELTGKGGVGRLVRQAEKVVDPVLDGFERRLPKPARSYFHQARMVSRAVQRTLLPS